MEEFVDQTNAEVRDLSQDWFETMDQKEQVRFVQRALAGQGAYDGPLNGTLDGPTKEAIGAYESANGLLADGRVTYALYASLIAGDLALGKEPDPKATPAVFEPRRGPVGATPLYLNLTTPKGPKARYNPGEAFSLTLRTNADAFVYCYYQDAGGQVVRLFPNRYAPDPFIHAQEAVEVPGVAPFDLVPEVPNSLERILCLGAQGEVGTLLPAAFKRDDLAPLPVPGLDQVARVFAASTKAPLSKAEVQIQVLGG